MLHVEHLEKVIEMRCVLSIDQLDAQAGEIVAVIGPVGSGKSLLIRLLSGQLQPSTGTVTLNGQDVFKIPSARLHMGVLFDEDLLYERHTAQANIELYAHLQHLPKSRVHEVLTLVELSDQAEKRITKLSSSAQRRLAFARMVIAQTITMATRLPNIAYRRRLTNTFCQTHHTSRYSRNRYSAHRRGPVMGRQVLHTRRRTCGWAYR